jgi:hypothetical protein
LALVEQRPAGVDLLIPIEILLAIPLGVFCLSVESLQTFKLDLVVELPRHGHRGPEGIVRQLAVHVHGRGFYHEELS